MPDKDALIDQLTYPHLETVSRAVHVVAFDHNEDPRTPERAATVQAKMLGLLMARLEQTGAISATDIDDILLDAAL